MAKSPETSLQSSRLRKLVGLAITDAKFRKALESNPKEAINSKRQELEFGYDELAKVSVDVLIEKAHDSDGTV
ncbi:MAG: hypothetical protein ABI348_06440 [Nitrososphaera sp.]|jgi:hypothetical protein